MDIRITNKRDFEIEVGGLDGNIVRICVSDDMDEIQESCRMALLRLKAIRDYRCKEISDRRN